MCVGTFVYFLTGFSICIAQESEAVEKMLELCLIDTDFPKRYAVYCNYEAAFDEGDSVLQVRSSQYFAFDSKSKVSRVMADQESVWDLNAPTQGHVNLWIAENGVEWSDNKGRGKWTPDEPRLCAIFNPKNIFVCNCDFIDHSLTRWTTSGVLSGRDCLSAENRDGFNVSKWGMKECEGVNRITILKHRIGQAGPPEELVLLPSVEGGWTIEKQKQRSNRTTRNIVKWAKVNDDLWVPKEVKMISQVRTDGRDCEREAIFKMKWVLGESVPDSLFEDPRAKPNQPNEFAKLNFSETPTSSP
jgi:hypothetical protein